MVDIATPTSAFSDAYGSVGELDAAGLEKARIVEPTTEAPPEAGGGVLRSPLQASAEYPSPEKELLKVPPQPTLASALPQTRRLDLSRPAQLSSAAMESEAPSVDSRAGYEGHGFAPELPCDSGENVIAALRDALPAFNYDEGPEEDMVAKARQRLRERKQREREAEQLEQEARERRHQQMEAQHQERVRRIEEDRRRRRARNRSKDAQRVSAEDEQRQKEERQRHQEQMALEEHKKVQARLRAKKSREQRERAEQEEKEAEEKRRVQAEAEKKAARAQILAKRRLLEQKKAEEQKKEEAESLEKMEKEYENDVGQDKKADELRRRAQDRVRQRVEAQKRHEEESRVRQEQEAQQREEQAAHEAQEIALRRERAAKRAAERRRKEREEEEKARVEKEEAERLARERKMKYKNPQLIAQLKAREPSPMPLAEEQKRRKRTERKEEVEKLTRYGEAKAREAREREGDEQMSPVRSSPGRPPLPPHARASPSRAASEKAPRGRGAAPASARSHSVDPVSPAVREGGPEAAAGGRRPSVTFAGVEDEDGMTGEAQGLSEGEDEVDEGEVEDEAEEADERPVVQAPVLEALPEPEEDMNEEDAGALNEGEEDDPGMEEDGQAADDAGDQDAIEADQEDVASPSAADDQPGEMAAASSGAFEVAAAGTTVRHVAVELPADDATGNHTVFDMAAADTPLATPAAAAANEIAVGLAVAEVVASDANDMAPVAADDSVGFQAGAGSEREASDGAEEAEMPPPAVVYHDIATPQASAQNFQELEDEEDDEASDEDEDAADISPRAAQALRDMKAGYESAQAARGIPSPSAADDQLGLAAVGWTTTADEADEAAGTAVASRVAVDMAADDVIDDRGELEEAAAGPSEEAAAAAADAGSGLGEGAGMDTNVTDKEEDEEECNEDDEEILAMEGECNEDEEEILATGSQNSDDAGLMDDDMQGSEADDMEAGMYGEDEDCCLDLVVEGRALQSQTPLGPRSPADGSNASPASVRAADGVLWSASNVHPRSPLPGELPCNSVLTMEAALDSGSGQASEEQVVDPDENMTSASQNLAEALGESPGEAELFAAEVEELRVRARDELARAGADGSLVTMMRELLQAPDSDPAVVDPLHVSAVQEVSCDTAQAATDVDPMLAIDGQAVALKESEDPVITEEPSTEGPQSDEHPVITEEPSTEEPQSDEPSTEEPQSDEHPVITEEPSTEEPQSDEPSTEEPQEPSTEEPQSDERSIEEPKSVEDVFKPCTEEPQSDERSIEEPQSVEDVFKPRIEEPQSDEQPAEEPQSDERLGPAAADDAAASEAAADASPAEEPQSDERLGPAAADDAAASEAAADASPASSAGASLDNTGLLAAGGNPRSRETAERALDAAELPADNAAVAAQEMDASDAHLHASEALVADEDHGKLPTEDAAVDPQDLVDQAVSKSHIEEPLETPLPDERLSCAAADDVAVSPASAASRPGASPGAGSRARSSSSRPPYRRAKAPPQIVTEELPGSDDEESDEEECSARGSEFEVTAAEPPTAEETIYNLPLSAGSGVDVTVTPGRMPRAPSPAPPPRAASPALLPRAASPAPLPRAASSALPPRAASPALPPRAASPALPPRAASPAPGPRAGMASPAPAHRRAGSPALRASGSLRRGPADPARSWQAEPSAATGVTASASQPVLQRSPVHGPAAVISHPLSRPEAEVGGSSSRPASSDLRGQASEELSAPRPPSRPLSQPSSQPGPPASKLPAPPSRLPAPTRRESTSRSSSRPPSQPPPQQVPLGADPLGALAAARQPAAEKQGKRGDAPPNSAGPSHGKRSQSSEPLRTAHSAEPAVNRSMEPLQVPKHLRAHGGRSQSQLQRGSQPAMMAGVRHSASPAPVLPPQPGWAAPGEDAALSLTLTMRQRAEKVAADQRASAKDREDSLLRMLENRQQGMIEKQQQRARVM